ncbi:hypothetical protein [Methanosarcina horonobensis]|uniref:hypothetical protein n=1 Tax=Methanosarcina horonobensis TaxID=418008 RepID=UPI00064F95F0|nr:hypothetical protein [Methanosarcina horonobensis]
MISKNTSERWNIFQQKKAESIISHKGRIHIIIYGAYNPPGDGEHLGEKERLIKLRDYLRNNGYISTYIVEDFPSDEKSISSNLDKSFDCLKFADLNILVFTCRGKTDSVTSELKYVIGNNLLSKCRVFEETHNGIPAMGTLLKEELRTERYHVVSVEYDNDIDLHEHVLGDVFSFFEKYIRTSRQVN